MLGKELANLHSRFCKCSEPFLNDAELLDLEKELREIENYMRDMRHNIEASWFASEHNAVERCCESRKLKVLK